MNLGSIYQELGNLDQALATLQSLELKPDNPDARMNLGGIYQELGNFNQALASTLQSLELKPDNPDALINLGGIYKELGNLDQALPPHLNHSNSNLKDPSIMKLGLIKMALGQTKEARNDLLIRLKITIKNAGMLCIKHNAGDHRRSERISNR